MRERFTLSDIVIAAWRSREISANMHKQSGSRQVESVPHGEMPTPSPVSDVRDEGNAWRLPEGVNNGVAIPKKFFDENGDLNLSRVSGREAAAYINSLGIKLAGFM